MLYRTAFNIARRTICTNTRIFCALKNTSKFNLKRNSVRENDFCLQQNLNFMILKRFKSKGKTSKQSEDEEDEDDTYEIEVDDYLNTHKSKVIVLRVPSLRLDAVAKAGFEISRAKLDREFYNSNIRVNGQKCLKKGTTVHIGDEIDHVLRRSPTNPNYLIINRCVLVSVDVEDEVGINIKVVQNKSLLIENYSDE